MYGAATSRPCAFPDLPPASARHADDANASAPPSRARQRLKPRRVIYKSAALLRAAPALATAASAAELAGTRAIQRANEAAEGVRDRFKLDKCGPDVEVGDGDDEATNARKYERRLKMNRSSAAASRVRREAYTKGLENELVAMERQYLEALRLVEEEREVIRGLVAGREESDVSADEGASDVDRSMADVQASEQSEREPSVSEPAVASEPSFDSAQQPSLQTTVVVSELPKLEDTLAMPLQSMSDIALELPDFFLTPAATLDDDVNTFDFLHHS